MRKFLISVICALCVGAAFAAGENVATSKAFVDTAVALKQDKIPANDGTAQVLTNTGTAGTVGTREIYNATGEYAAQMESLVDAATMNAAVQNAIEAEFQCIAWVDNDPTKDCLLVEIRGVPQQPTLPAGYTPLEYIESTGTQWIDTGYTPSNATGVQTRVQINSMADDENVFFGAGESYLYKNFELYVWISKLEFNYNNYTFGNSVQLNDIVQIDWNKNVINYSINGVSQPPIVRNPTSFTVPYTMYLFALNRSGSASVPGKIKMYYFKIYNNNSLTRDYIPAKRDSDGVLGMYDTVTNTFFTNSGTGNFIAGPVQNLYLPSGN